MAYQSEAHHPTVIKYKKVTLETLDDEVETVPNAKRVY
jgi:hypothetical protein